MPNKSIYIIHYAEIALKGKNRKSFELQLIRNIKHVLGASLLKVNRQFGQIVLTIQPGNNQTVESLKQVFGISWFAPVQTTNLNQHNITDAALTLAQQEFTTTDFSSRDRGVPSELVLSETEGVEGRGHPGMENQTTFAIRADRSNKNLPFTSLDIEKQVGEAVRIKTGAKVDLTNPKHTVYIHLGDKLAYIYSHKVDGPGGLPVGSSGKVLVLLSGGFDSIAAAYQLARRGSEVDFLHFHIFTDTHKVIDSKIHIIASKLSAYTLSSKLYLASNLPYQMATLNISPVLEKQELIVFRRLMVRVGERLAQQHGYQALVLGDSLGQVASQTLENIVAVDQAIDTPVFRPLIGSDKVDIINLVKDIDLEKAANAPYKDCCSIISHHPATKANLDKIHTIESQINIDQLTNQLFDQVENIDL